MNAISILMASSESGLPAERIRKLLPADELFGVMVEGDLCVSRAALPWLRELARKAAPGWTRKSCPPLSDRWEDFGMRHFYIRHRVVGDPGKNADSTDPNWGMEPSEAQEGIRGEVEHINTGEREHAGSKKEK